MLIPEPKGARREGQLPREHGELLNPLSSNNPPHVCPGPAVLEVAADLRRVVGRFIQVGLKSWVNILPNSTDVLSYFISERLFFDP